MDERKSHPETETVVWELPKEMLKHLREYCVSHGFKECEAACRAIKGYLTDRLLEEGE